MSQDENRKPDDVEEETDVEGHNIFATQDYYFQRTHERNAEIDRDVRARERAKEAEKAKKDRR
jgi:hypothetical protein